MEPDDDFPQSLFGFEFLSSEEFGELEQQITEDNMALAKKVLAHRVRLPAVLGKSYSSASSKSAPAANGKGKEKAISKVTPSKPKSKKMVTRESSEEYK